MANKSKSKVKPNQRLNRLKTALRQAIASIDKVRSSDSENCKGDEVLFHIAFYLRQLHYRGLDFIHTHGISYL
jgi:hypothetical protein